MSNHDIPVAAASARSPVARGQSSLATLGALAVFLFGVETLTGLALMFHYRPTVAHAYPDLIDLREASSFGFVRELHHWGSQAFVIVVALHLVGIVLAGSHKPPRQLSWSIGVGLLVLTLSLAATGALLPWDDAAFGWLTSRTPSLAAADPGATGLEPTAPATDTAGDRTLIRIFVLHCGLLPVLTASLIFYHGWRARRDDRVAAERTETHQPAD